MQNNSTSAAIVNNQKSYPLLQNEIKLIIFDFDGVLVDTQEVSNEICYNYLKENHQIKMSFETFVNNFSGMRIDTIMEILTKEREIKNISSLNDISEVIDAQVLAYLTHQKITPLTGVLEFLEGLTLQRCIGSNSTAKWLQIFLESTNLARFFKDNVFSAEMVNRPKPAPDLYLYAAQRMGIKTEECLVIEDSSIGVQAAVEAGIQVIGFLAGSHISPHTEDRLLKAGANTVINDMRDLSLIL